MPAIPVAGQPMPPREALITPEGVSYYDTYTFANLVGESPAKIKRFRVEGLFMPAVAGRPSDPARGTSLGRGRKCLYSHDQIAEYKKTYTKVRISEAINMADKFPTMQQKGRSARTWYTSEEARVCFQSFEDGKDNLFCVLEYGVHPDTVKIIRRSWQQINDDVCALAVTRTELDEIQRMGFSGPEEITSGRELVELLRNASADAMCEVCNKRSKRVCARCAQPKPKRFDHDCFKRKEDVIDLGELELGKRAK